MIHFKQLEYWVDRGCIRAGSRVMDVGTQNLLFATEDQAIAMVEKLRPSSLSYLQTNDVRRICRETTRQPGKRVAFLYELLALTDVLYNSIDIFSGPATTIHDLNRDSIPTTWKSQFDIVINVGTLEHVFNQARAFEFIHDVLKVGGVWIEQSPSIGYLNHGYFQYHPQIYADLAEANGYEIAEAWYSKAGAYQTIDTNYALIDLHKLDSQTERDRIAAVANEVPTEQKTLAYNFNAVIRKTRDQPFRFPLESRTSSGKVSPEVAARYVR